MRKSNTSIVKRRQLKAIVPEQQPSSSRKINTIQLIAKKEFKTPELGKRELEFFSSSTGAMEKLASDCKDTRDGLDLTPNQKDSYCLDQDYASKGMPESDFKLSWIIKNSALDQEE